MKNRIQKSAGGTDLLRNAMLFAASFHGWTNRCVADKTKFEVKGDKKDVPKNVSMTKQLIICPEYDAILSAQRDLYGWMNRHAMLSGMGRSTMFVKRKVTLDGVEVDNIQRFSNHIKAQNAVIRDELVPALLRAYPAAKEQAKEPPIYDLAGKQTGGGLGSLYDEADYPTPEKLSESFFVSYRWFELSVPDELPDEVYAEECKKLREEFTEAREAVKYSLREGLSVLVNHAVEKLTVGPGEKPKIFRATAMVENFKGFFDTFAFKDITGDAELAGVVNRAQEIVNAFADSPDAIKTNSIMRGEVVGRFNEVKTALDGMLKDKPARRINLED